MGDIYMGFIIHACLLLYVWNSPQCEEKRKKRGGTFKVKSLKI